MHMPKLWPLSQSQFTPAIQLYVCMCKATERIQTPQIQPIIMQQYCTILLSNVLGPCSELRRCFTLQTTRSQPCSLIRGTIPTSSCNSLLCCLADTKQPLLITSTHTLPCTSNYDHAQRCRSWLQWEEIPFTGSKPLSITKFDLTFPTLITTC